MEIFQEVTQWTQLYLNINLKETIEMYSQNLTNCQLLVNRFCKFGLVSTYKRFSATFRPKSATFWKLFHNDSGHDRCLLFVQSEPPFQNTYSSDSISGMKLGYAKLILSLQLLDEIERVKMCVQILKNINKDWKMWTTNKVR